MKTTTATSKADLHVHSKYSNRPAEWFPRRIGAPVGFMEPLEVYHASKAAGMDYVTISGHNRIEGACEIAICPAPSSPRSSPPTFPKMGARFLAWLQASPKSSSARWTRLQ